MLSFYLSLPLLYLIIHTQAPVEQVKVADLVLVRAGDRVPLDSCIVEGSSFMNENILSFPTPPLSPLPLL